MTQHRFFFTPVCRSLLAAVAVLGIFVGTAEAGDNAIYTLTSRSGVRSFSDIKQAPNALEYISKYGRPTATLSCRGMRKGDLLAREAIYDGLINKHARANRLHPELVKAVMRAESCFDRKAVSSVGAKGLMQLMPATAASLGVSDSFDAEQNIRGGTRYLRMMMDRFDNKLDWALAAYNAGPGAVEKYQSIPPFRETQAYVRKIQRAYKAAIS